jgi:hypothetical protein
MIAGTGAGRKSRKSARVRKCGSAKVNGRFGAVTCSFAGLFRTV